MAASSEPHKPVETAAARNDNQGSYLWRTAVFVGAACGSFVLGFAYSMHKSKGPGSIKKTRPDIGMLDEGTKLASKALMVGTAISVTGVSLMVLATFKLLGVRNFRELHEKIREYYPKPPPQGRTEFESLQDLADYLVSEDRKAELERKRKLETLGDENAAKS